MTSFDYHAWAGKSAGILSFIGFIPYIISAIRGTNRPNRATWIIWSVLGVILLASYRSAGATDAIWLSVANVIAFGAILIISFKHGEGSWDRLDLFCLSGAAFGLFLWWYLKSPLPALYLSVLIDLIGALPTFKKSYLDPVHENKLAWIIFWSANTVNLFALREWSMAMAAYPVYMFLLSGALAILLIVRQKLIKVHGAK